MVNKDKSRIDIIGQNGNTGEHYEEVEEAMPNGRWNWYGEGEDEPVWKEEKLGGKAANLRNNMWKVHDQNEAARRKMNELSAYEKVIGQDGTVANNMALLAAFGGPAGQKAVTLLQEAIEAVAAEKDSE